MTQRIAVLAVLLALGGLLPAAAGAQELYNYTVTAMAGVGGGPDSDTDDSLSHGTYQLGFSLVTEPRTHLGLRLGRLSFDQDEPQGGLLDAELSYLTLAGEYRFRESFYDSGIYLGVGGYQLDGTDLLGNDDDETAIGLALGLTSEFEINRRFGVQLELSGHYTDLDALDLLILGHVGVAVHFR